MLKAQSRRLTQLLPQLGAGLSLSAIGLSVLSIPLAAASHLDLSPAQTTGWILSLYALPGVLSLAAALKYRQPLFVTGNVFVMIFVASLGTQLTWAELVGASMTAGALVLLLGALGLTGRLATWLPSPIVYGLLAGAVLPFLIDLFAALGTAPRAVGIVLVAYAAGGPAFRGRVPPIIPALVAGLLVALFQADALPDTGEGLLPAPALTLPEFSAAALLTATPVMVVLITLQANVPSLVFLRNEQYRPPERLINFSSGAGVLAGSLLGPIGISLSLPATALVAGRDAGGWASRHRAVYIAGGFHVLVGLLAGLAAGFAAVVPPALLDAVVGLAVAGILTTALREATRGPLLLGPIFAFAVSQSGLTLLGLGSFFWALAIGLLASYLLEHEGWKKLRSATEDAG
ncbi:MAG: benzoate/H(+) symporter BenE family transporter [Thermoleophilia bacterium]